MASPTQILALVFVILGLLSLVRWWRMGFKRTNYPLWPLVLTIIGVWAILLTVSWFTDSKSEFAITLATGKGYLIGTLIMYIGAKATKGK